MLKDSIQGFEWFSYFLPGVWAAEIIVTELGLGTLIVVQGDHPYLAPLDAMFAKSVKGDLRDCNSHVPRHTIA